MKRIAVAVVLLVLAVMPYATAQTPAEDAKAVMEAFQAAWEARDADALAECLNDPLIGYFQPGQVADRPGMLDLARTIPKMPIEVTHGDYAPEIYGNVAFALMPTHLKPGAELGLAEFDGLTGSAVLLKTDDVWRVVAGCNLWDADAMAAWAPGDQGTQVRQLDQAAQAAWDEFQARADEALAGGTVDWEKFGALFHPQGVTIGPTGEGDGMVARVLKPDGETVAEDVPAVSLSPVADQPGVVVSGWGAIVQAYPAQASVNAGAPFPCRIIDIRCYDPQRNTWQYLLAALVPTAE